jgi:Druantia protein DruA
MTSPPTDLWEATTVLRFRGREISAADAAFIRELIAKHPDKSRRALSVELCHAWRWYQTNGATRDMYCRSLMLELSRAGHIELPPRRGIKRNPLAEGHRPKHVDVERTPIESSLRELGPLTIRQVRRTQEERVVNGLIEEHHYLGYTHPVGESLKHLVLAGDRPVACFTWSSAPRHLGPRDRFIGWKPEVRRANLHLLAYNGRFLVLPWVHVPHLASHLLGHMARRLSSDWQEVYGHPVHFVETFVHTERFKGTCYRAANWIQLGRTTGRGKDAQTKRANRPIKDVLGLPLTKRFRERMGVR